MQSDPASRLLDPIDWLSFSAGAADPRAAWASAAQRLADLDFETSGIVFAMPRGAPAIPGPDEMSGTIISPEWHSYYCAHPELIRADPFAHALFRSEGTHYWHESGARSFDPGQDSLVLDQVRDHGMRGSFGASVFDRRGGTVSVLVGATLTPGSDFGRTCTAVSDRIGLAFRYLVEGLSASQARRREDERPLSPRERECLLHAATGLGTQQIADALALSDRSVEGHLAAAIQKLGAANRTQACVRAILRDLIQP